jgi:uncharacterized Ntn-hydrolase superfamily protein
MRLAMIRVLLLVAVVQARVAAQDTFSIVAVDTLTGEVGSAGASCVGSSLGGVGAYILSDVIEGVGAIHTQASYLAANQTTARQRMLMGDSPQQIIDWMVTHDAQNNPTIRQYGVIDVRRRGESAAYTGVNCTNYKNHAAATGYAVQGNILSGQAIIDTIKNTFLRTPGPLADRLMKALEAAMIIGADTRCASRGTSSQSSFIRVVRIGDGNRSYLLHVVPDSPVGVDPIGLLRTKFNQWKDSLSIYVDPFLSRLTLDQDSIPANGASSAVLTIVPKNNSDSVLSSGRTILVSHTGAGSVGSVTDLGNGTYVCTITAPLSVGTDTLSVRVVSGVDTVRIAWRPVLHYVSTTAVQIEQTALPDRFVLQQNYPNPFNATTRIEFDLVQTGFASLKIYDLAGRVVATLFEELGEAGRHSVQFEGAALSSGVYYYQLRFGSSAVTRRMALIR